MDYDATSMPAVYDAGRGYSPETLDLWLTAIARAAGPSRTIDAILDLGCGTGRYSGPLANHFAASVIALDPSEQMLARARDKKARDVTYVHGSGEKLPLADASVDLVFMSMVFHHFAQPAQVAGECHRVLRPGGVVVIRAGAADRIDAFPYVPFFPLTAPLIQATLGPIAAIETTFVAAGFEPSVHEVIMSEVGVSWSEYADKISLRADSILVQLDDAAFAFGLAALRAYAAQQRTPQPVIEPVDLLAFRRG